MFRGKLIVFAALAVFFAQLQCAAACTTQFCHKAPPCHRQHQSPCHEDVGVAATPLQIWAVPVPGVVISLTAPAVLPLNLRRAAEHHNDNSPPGLQRLSAFVLRI